MAYRGRHKEIGRVKICAWIDAHDWAWLQTRHRYQASDRLRWLLKQYRHQVENPREFKEWEPLPLEEL